MTTAFIVLSLLIGFYLLWNMGANDVANSMGTAIGSKAISLKTALLIAASLEFLGSYILGSNVSETLQRKIIHVQFFELQPMLFILGMLSVLLGSAIWLQIATFLKLPVSTTHAIIGAITGFGVAIFGFRAIQWNVIGTIALSWIFSPLLSACVSGAIFAFIQKKIFRSYNPVSVTKTLVPILTFILLFIFIFSLFANGIETFRLFLAFHWIFLIACSTATVGFSIATFLCKKVPVPQTLSLPATKKKEKEVHRINQAYRYLLQAKLASSKKEDPKITQVLSLVHELLEEKLQATKWEDHTSSDYQTVEKIFGFLQILSACSVAFAHGANDVANAIGPVSAVFTAITKPEQLFSNASFSIPPFLLLFGGISIVIGLFTHGWRVIETIGTNITTLTPTRGFSAEFGASITILFASKLGLPISTTHAIVGSVLGVGLTRGLFSLNFNLIRGIFLSWVITIPASAILCIFLLHLCMAIFL